MSFPGIHGGQNKIFETKLILLTLLVNLLSTNISDCLSYSETFCAPGYDFEAFNMDDSDSNNDDPYQPMPASTRPCSSCRDRCGMEAYDKYQVCMCDDVCLLYGDCCLDFASVCPSTHRAAQELKHQLDITDTVLNTTCNRRTPLVHYCPHNSEACRTGVHDFDDIPVRDRVSGISFVNAKCAACNGIQDVEVWSITVINECIHNKLGNHYHYTPEDVYDLIIQGLCNYSSYAQTQPYRFCGRSPDKKCAPNCANRELVNACLLNGTQQVSVGSEIFANKYCALCNSASDISENIRCLSTTFVPSHESNPPSYEILFKFNPSSNSGLSICDAGEVYQRGSRGCQPKGTCSPGYEFINEDFGCREISCYRSYKFYSRKDGVCQPNCNDGDRIDEFNCENVSRCLEGSYIDKYIGCCPIDKVVINSDNTSICQQIVMTNDRNNSIEEVYLQPASLKYAINVEVTWSPSENYFHVGVIFEYTHDICQRLHDIQILHDKSSNYSFRCKVTLNSYTSLFLNFIIETNTLQMHTDVPSQYYLDAVWAITNILNLAVWRAQLINVDVQRISYIGAFRLTCPHVILNNSQWEIQGHEIVFTNSKKKLTKDKFSIKNDQLFVCLEEVRLKSRKTGIENNRNDFVLGILTLVCMLLSATGLIIRLSIQFCIADFQTFPMKLQSIFCLALLIPVIMFSFISLVKPGGSLCIIYAIVMHYGFLSAFTWMGIVSFDMFRVFHSLNQLDRFAIKPGWKTMLRYQVIGWGLPLVISTTSLLSEYAMPISNQYKPGYGIDNCWLSNEGFGVFIYFGAPVFLIIAINCIIFIATSISLQSAFKQSRNVRSQDKLHWKAYIKLFVVMGCSYILLLLTPFVNHIALWIVIILLNASQGLHICIAFVCKRKLFYECYEKFSGHSLERELQLKSQTTQLSKL